MLSNVKRHLIHPLLKGLSYILTSMTSFKGAEFTFFIGNTRNGANAARMPGTS